jgi:transposase-like protein
MRGQPVPQPVKDLIINRVKNGEKVDDIASEFKIYPNTIRKWLKDEKLVSDGVGSAGATGITGRSPTSSALLISKLQREKQELLEIIGELTVLTKRSKKN